MIWRSPLPLAGGAGATAGAPATGAAATRGSPPAALAADALHPASTPSPSAAHARVLSAQPRAMWFTADRGAAAAAGAAARAPQGASAASARGSARAPQEASVASAPGCGGRGHAPPASWTPTDPAAAGYGPAALAVAAGSARTPSATPAGAPWAARSTAESP